MFLMTHRAVFFRSCPSPWTEDYAILGGRPVVSPSGAAVPELETDAELAFAFRTAADLLAERWSAKGMDDSLVLVVLYNYRHALELGLKVVLRALVDSIRSRLRRAMRRPRSWRKSARISLRLIS